MEDVLVFLFTVGHKPPDAAVRNFNQSIIDDRKTAADVVPEICSLVLKEDQAADTIAKTSQKASNCSGYC